MWSPLTFEPIEFLFFPIGSLWLETSATALCGPYVTIRHALLCRIHGEGEIITIFMYIYVQVCKHRRRLHSIPCSFLCVIILLITAYMIYDDICIFGSWCVTICNTQTFTSAPDNVGILIAARRRRRWAWRLMLFQPKHTQGRTWG